MTPDLSRVLAAIQPRSMPAIDPDCCPTCREAWLMQQERQAHRVIDEARRGLR